MYICFSVLPVQAETAELDDIVYYFRYAEAVYGWPLVLFEEPLTGCCSLCSLSWYVLYITTYIAMCMLLCLGAPT